MKVLKAKPNDVVAGCSLMAGAAAVKRQIVFSGGTKETGKFTFGDKICQMCMKDNYCYTVSFVRLNKHRKSTNLPGHHNIRLSFWGLSFRLSVFLISCLKF